MHATSTCSAQNLQNGNRGPYPGRVFRSAPPVRPISRKSSVPFPCLVSLFFLDVEQASPKDVTGTKNSWDDQNTKKGKRGRKNRITPGSRTLRFTSVPFAKRRAPLMQQLLDPQTLPGVLVIALVLPTWTTAYNRRACPRFLAPSHTDTLLVVSMLRRV